MSDVNANITHNAIFIFYFSSGLPLRRCRFPIHSGLELTQSAVFLPLGPQAVVGVRFVYAKMPLCILTQIRLRIDLNTPFLPSDISR